MVRKIRTVLSGYWLSAPAIAYTFHGEIGTVKVTAQVILRDLLTAL